MNSIEQIDVFTLKLPHHYKIAGHEDTPNRLPGTNYYLEPQWEQAYSNATESCLVKITLEDGSFGWGEAQAPITPETTATLMTTLLGPSLLGQDADSIEELNNRMHGLMRVRGHLGSFLVDAIAGLDIALWDLKGKRCGEPVSALLGGAAHTRLSAYVSGLRKKTIEEKVDAARAFEAHGFAGIKIFVDSDAAKAEHEALALKAVLRPETFFAIDALWSYDLESAIRVGRFLEQIGGGWLEAPLDPENLEAHHALIEKTSTPIAVGEMLRTPRAFEPWLRGKALTIAQPDVMRSGISGTLKIAALAREYDVQTTLHVGVGTAIGIAATWQVAATLTGSLPQEHQCDLFQVANAVLSTPIVEKNGHLEVPTGPGVGVNVDETIVLANSTEHWIVDRKGRRLAKGER